MKLLLVILLIALAFLLLKIFARLWNAFNLDLRSCHKQMASLHIDYGNFDSATHHIQKAQKLQKWFIRYL